MRLKTLLATQLLLLLVWALPVGAAKAVMASHEAMLREIKDMVMATRDYLGKDTLSPGVMEAMRTVPRHEFVPESLHASAYLNRPLPIGHEQTISQPYIVALMTDLAGVNRDSVVLEIGTGSGYQAAVLAQLVNHVYTIEIIDALAITAQATLARLGYENVTVRSGDGYHGWPEHAPFDAIVVTAAPEQIPQPLIEQLRAGGRMIIPLGPVDGIQTLRVLTKDASGGITELEILPVGFVPFAREE